MPKRLLDDSYLSSPSLAKCSPRAQDAFPRFILLADDFGCFEVTPRALVGKGWPNRDDVSETDVVAFLEEYVRAGMACLYTAQERRICYLTGWNGPHGQKKRAEYDPNAPAGTPGRHGSKRRLPAPPADLVAAVVAGARRDHDGKPPGLDREDPEERASDSTPAREMAGSRPAPATVPAVPGPVVPDAVPVAGSHTHARAAARLVSPYPEGQDPNPATTAVLAALFDRGRDAAPPGAGSAARVEAAIKFATIPVAVDRLAAVYANPDAKKPLTYHVDAIRGDRPKRSTNIGDLGCEVIPWWQRLTDEQARAYVNERTLIDPDLDGAPIGVPGENDQCADLNAKWRAVAEGR
jgi:hypothetical protein